METLAFRNPRLVVLVLLVIVAGGLSSLLSIGRQEDPTITNLFATVTTVFPGAEPERVEALVSAEIESALKEIPEIDVIESTSSTGISIVSIELVETLADTRIEQIWSETRDALDDAARSFPAGVLEPEFSSDGAGAYGAIIALYPNAPDFSPSLLTRYGDGLADALRSVPGTMLVETFGGVEEEVLVSVDPMRAAALGLTASSISQAITASDAKVPAGQVRPQGTDLNLTVEGEIASLERLRRVIVSQNGAGQATYLGDIAEITRGARTPAAEMALQDGTRAVLVAARVEDGLQVDAWMVNVRDELSAYQGRLPEEVRADLVFDQSGYTADRLAEVGTNMAIGMALVVAILFVTLGARSAVIVALVLPIVSLATLMTMNLIKLPIHQMSVTGLIVALGLLVDAAIVMTDDIGRRLKAGASRAAAVGDAVRRLFAPLLASTVTTALSFTPMILLPGPAGDFVGSIAIAVVLMLVWSFVIAIVITPAIAGWTLTSTTTSRQRSLIGRGFERLLALSMANPLRSITLALVLPVSGFLAMPTLTQQFFPGVERDQFHIEVELADGAGIAATEATARQLDRVLASKDGIEQVSWVLGRSAPPFYYNIVADRDGAPNFAHALVTTASNDATNALLATLQVELSNQFPEARILVRGLVQGPPVDAPIELRLVGPNLEELRRLGDDVRRIVADQDLVTVARTTAAAAPAKLSLEVDEDRARLLGLDLGGVSAQLQSALDGVTGGSLLEGTQQMPVRVRFGDALRSSIQDVADMPIVAPAGLDASATGGIGWVPLSALASFELVPSDPVITRRNSERVNTVQAFVQEGVLPEEALADVRNAIESEGFTLPAGYRLEIGGDSDARSSTLNNLLASLGLIVTLSVAAVVLTFNSFRLSAVTFVVAFLSAGLSILSLAVFQFPFGINAVIGVIGSIGVSINAAIIILTGLQADPQASSGDRDAIVRVVMGSSRHITSTTLTTFAGFLPLILAGGGFWPPFAMAVAGGVLLSAVVSFFFTPQVFVLIHKRQPGAAGSAVPTLSVVAPSPTPASVAAE